MSRIGKKIIAVDQSVSVEIKSNVVTLSSDLGSLSCQLPTCLDILFENSQISILTQSNSKRQRSLHGLFRSLIYNNHEGLTKGFSNKMVLSGIGYKVQSKGKDLEFSLGFSHPVLYKCPAGIVFEVESPDKFSIKGICKALVGQITADILSLRKRDAYKGKGIYFLGETKSLKQGKKIKK